MTNAAVLDEILKMDALCLREPSGGALDLERRRVRLTASLSRALIASVRRSNTLVAYGYMWPLEQDRWFVGGLAIDPRHRNAGVAAALFRKFNRMVHQSGAGALHSQVLATNDQSLRLHRRLGFKVVRSDDRAVAFAARVSDLSELAFLRDLRES